MRLIRPCDIVFADDDVEKEYLSLKENSDLKKWIDRAKEDIKNNAFCGIQVPKKLFLGFMCKNMEFKTYGNMICLMVGGLYIQ